MSQQPPTGPYGQMPQPPTDPYQQMPGQPPYSAYPEGPGGQQYGSYPQPPGQPPYSGYPQGPQPPYDGYTQGPGGAQYPYAPPSHRKKHRQRKWLLVASAVFAGIIAVVVVVVILAASGASPVKVHGQLEVAADALNGTNTSDYSDISDGAQVTVVNSSGTVIANGTLSFSKAENLGLISADIYNFTVTVPGGLSRYGIQVGQNRGTVWESASQMKAGPSLCLGDGC